MTYTPTRPRYSIPFNGKDYEVEGTFKCIEAVEATMQESFLVLLMQVTPALQATSIVKLFHAILTSNGHKIEKEEIGNAVSEMGMGGAEYNKLCLHLYAFMRLTITPPADRDRVRYTLGEQIGEATALAPEIPSPGRDSNNSASASLSGRPQNSGKRTSGTPSKQSTAT